MAGGLSSYRFDGLSPDPRDAADPRSAALARNPMNEADSAGLDQMLQNIDRGAVAPDNMSDARRAVPSQGSGQNPWLEWLMQYLQTKGQPTPQGQPR